MKIALFLALTYFYLLVKGIRASHYCMLAYLWLSFLVPQWFAQALFYRMPFAAVALFFGALFYIMIDWRPLPKVTPVFIVSIVLVFWITFTTVRAFVPELAWVKWGYAYKSILLVPIMPFFLRTRVQIESGLIAIFGGLLPHIISAGLKTLFGNVRYGSFPTLLRVNQWLGETSTLAVAAVMSLAFAYYLTRKSLASEHLPLRGLSFFGYTGAALLTMIGSYARTGPIALAALLFLGVRSIRLKIGFILALLVLGPIVYLLLPQSYTARMASTASYEQDTSATGRMVVWQWTLDFVKQHPLGGGFDVYVINGLYGEGGRAFHSIYFETLGEQGYPGLAMFLIIFVGSLIGLFRLSRREYPPEGAWIQSFAGMLFASLIAFLAGGAFIGVAYQPLGYVIVGLYVCLLQAVKALPVALPPAGARVGSIVFPTRSAPPASAPIGLLR